MLKNTRPPLVQLMWSKDIVVTNITLQNSPFWHFHPYDCTNVTVSDVTILAPISGAPNTDGIDPGIHPATIFNDFQYNLFFFLQCSGVTSSICIFVALTIC